MHSRKLSWSESQTCSMSFAPWIYFLPWLEATPIEIFLSAPPRPAIGWPLKCDSTSIESYSGRVLPT